MLIMLIQRTAMLLFLFVMTLLSGGCAAPEAVTEGEQAYGMEKEGTVEKEDGAAGKGSCALPLDLFPGDEQEAGTAGKREALPALFFSTKEIAPGDFFIVYLDGAREEDRISVETELIQGEAAFFPYGEGMVALVGVNYRTPAGPYNFKLELEREGTVLLAEDEIVSIVPKSFATQHLQVTERQQAKRREELWQQDRQHTARARSLTSREPLWEGAFIMPVQGRITTEFGVVRYINNAEAGRHSGLDIAAPHGTPVRAANGGVVNLAMHLYVTGHTVIIDHGFNLFSAYAHLDRLMVEEGERVEKGTVIGEVGSTGFSTGPHLHWTVSVGPVFTNPWLFLEECPLSWLLLKD